MLRSGGMSTVRYRRRLAFLIPQWELEQGDRVHSRQPGLATWWRRREMFGSAIVEVVIGLAFVYFILSVIASHLNELIAGALGWRAAGLERGLRALLADVPGLADSVWQHGLVSGLSSKPGRGPSYVPSTNFAMALSTPLDTAVKAPLEGQSLPPLFADV